MGPKHMSYYRKQPYFNKQRGQLADRDYKQGGSWIKECCKKLIFVNAIEQIESQKLQQGFYILFRMK